MELEAAVRGVGTGAHGGQGDVSNLETDGHVWQESNAKDAPFDSR